MAGSPPPYPPPQPPYGQDWRYQRKLLREQAKVQREQYRYQMRALRRRSILGPIMLILVGVIFFLIETGHLQADRFWGWYGHWWPLLLVLAGLILLAEWGFDQFLPHDPQHPRARRSVGGGVVALFILLMVAGIAFNAIASGHHILSHQSLFNSDNLVELFGDKHESDQSLTQQFPANGTLSINIPRGDVSVIGTSTDGLVHITLHKEVYSRSDADAESKAQKLVPSISTNENQLAIAVPSMNGSVVDMNLTVPPVSGLTINANHGDVRVRNILAPITLTANHGDVNVSSISGSVIVRMNNGDSDFSAHQITGPLTLEGHSQDVTLSDITGPVNLTGDFYGTSHLEHITNALRFHTSRTDLQLARLDGELEISPDADLSADQAVGPMLLTTRNRNITLDRISGEVVVTNRNGTVDLTSAPPLGNVTVQNRNGSVNLTLPDHASFAVRAQTTDGDVENDFSLPSEENGSHKTLSGTVGKGESLIRINTSQGDVSLRRASIAPLPPAPPKPPAVSIKGEDGSSVYVGKDGVRIISGADGSKVILGKDGLNISSGADGSSVYKAPDGTRLIENVDGSKIYVGPQGTRYAISADGSKSYRFADGATLVIDADGSEVATAAGGGQLTSAEIRKHMHEAEHEIREVEKQREKEQKRHTAK